MSSQAPARKGYRPGGLEFLAAALILLVIAQRWLVGLFDNPALQTGATIFVSIVVQALPFLVMGVLLSGAIAAFVPASFWRKALPRNQVLAVPVAGAAGAILPGCECASVPVANGLMSRGVAPAAALAFLLSSPAINPIVLVSTYVAFPNDPMMVVGRLVASLGAAIVMGWLWLRFGKAEWLRVGPRDHLTGDNPWHTFRLTATHDFLHAGGFLVVGGLAAAALNVLVPQDWLGAVADNPILSVLALAALAVILCICSEADAFVAASLTEFSLTAKLAFLVVGPMVDIKLVSLQAGTFGRRFALRFAPTTFVVAVLASVIVGWWLLT
ncbi:MAG: permease [Actinomycetota bacterium]